MTDKRTSKWTPEPLLKMVTIALVFLLAGPEFLVAIEQVSFIEVVGVFTFWSAILRQPTHLIPSIWIIRTSKSSTA